jgi:hypothetical protein
VTAPSASTGSGAAPRGLSQRAHRQLIGYLGLLLPFLLYVIAGLRPTAGLVRWELLTSVSAYYYTGAIAVFVGVIFALSLFLFTYRGYAGVLADQVLGAVGGSAALGVALFPTAAPQGLPEPTWWSGWVGVVHYGSAVVLFLAFILFSIWLFRKSSIPTRADRPLDKRRRDDICLACGIVMILAVLGAGWCASRKAPIFWPEAVAIEAFALSWLVKGEARRTAMDAFRRMWRSHPSVE